MKIKVENQFFSMTIFLLQSNILPDQIRSKTQSMYVNIFMRFTLGFGRLDLLNIINHNKNNYFILLKTSLYRAQRIGSKFISEIHSTQFTT